MAHIANGRDPGNCVSLLRVNVSFVCLPYHGDDHIIIIYLKLSLFDETEL